MLFNKLPEKLRKRGYDLYVHVSRAFNSLPRKGIGPLLHCNYVVGPLEGSGRIRTHNPKPEKKRK